MRVPFNWLKEYVNINITPKELAQKLTLVGHALDKPLYEQEGDTVMDLEARGSRGDVTGILGIARDVAALTGQKIKYPKLATIPGTDNKQFLPKITVESERVIRWRAVTFKNVKVGPSPEHVQKKLKSYGMEVINNIVDMTNYVMIETGMPIHAFDLDELASITLRTARPGESLVTFEGGKLLFDENDLIAADGNVPLTLTTAVGGRESGISDATKNVLIEAGLYDQPTARRSALRLNVRNETAGRLGKYLHPEYCDLAVARAVELMKELLGVEPDPVSFDYYPNPYHEIYVELTQGRLDLLAGEHVDLKEATEIIKSLEFGIITPPDGWKDHPSGVINVKIPYFRTDITMEDDVIEEVLRIRGYDKIPVYLPNRPAPEKLEFPEMDLESGAKDALVKLGYNETISQQIVDREDIKKVGFWDESKVVQLQNSWNEELNVLRYDLASPQLKYLITYQKHGIDNIKIFEVGKTYTKDEKIIGYEKYKETRKIAFTINGNFFALKSDILTFLSELGLSNVEFKKYEFSLFKNHVSATIYVNGNIVGKFGEIKEGLLANFGIESKTVSHVVLYTEKLLKHLNITNKNQIETKLENYVVQDSTFKVGSDVEIGEILRKLERAMDQTTRINFLGVFENEELKKQKSKNVTFNFKFDPEKAQSESLILKGLTF